MRVSLYPHELAVVERLTLELVREAQPQGTETDTLSLGVAVFEKLLDVLYARGFYKHPWRSIHDTSAEFQPVDFREVT